MAADFLLRVFLTALLIGSGFISSAQAVADYPLDKRQSILNGRAFADFPSAAVNSARPTDIMSADRNANQETRIMLDMPPARLVFFAQELYALGDKKALTRFADEQDHKAGATTTVVADNGSLFAVQSTPTAFDSTREAILVNSLLVRTADNTVFRLAAYVNPAAYGKRAEFVKLSTRVFATLTAGTRRPDRTAHVETLDILNTKKKLRITLPANYTVTTDQKYDFQVFTLHHYRDLGDEQREKLTIYVGRHPSYLFRNFQFERDEAQLSKGTFLGKSINWLYFTNAEKQIYLKEQQLPRDDLATGLLLHVSLLGSTPHMLDELTKIAGAVELIN